MTIKFKYFYVALIILSCQLFITSCKKDSNNNNILGSDSTYANFDNGPIILKGFDLFPYLSSSFTSIRYSPAILVDNNGGIDLWLTLPGGYSIGGLAYFNQISYMHSDDAGKSWSSEEIVLKPTDAGKDQYYVRNPSVVKYENYYYLTYESRTNGTTTSTGSNNNLYVARATSPNGIWQKWNGSGWGGTPASIMSIVPNKVTCYGVGESSLLIKNDSLYIYYSLGKDSAIATRTVCNKVYIKDSLWPSKLVAAKTDTILKRNVRNSDGTLLYYGSDRITFKYDQVRDQFFGLGIVNRLTDSSYIQMWSSKDGINYQSYGKLTQGIQTLASFVGISGDSLGHWNSEKYKYMSYTYGNASVLLANTYFNLFEF
jgi:hypothetical protein